MSGAESKPPLPSLFIASSTEGLSVAYDVQEALEFDCHATVWKQGVFEPSHTVMQDLLQAVARQDFALFVLTPDDALTLRGQAVQVVRDNVVFELGLFIGALGVERCVHLVPRGAPALHLPSDLAGLLALDYPSDRPDGNRLAALGPACNKLRRRLRSTLPPRHRFGAAATFPAGSAASAGEALDRYLLAWQAEPLLTDRATLRAGITLHPYAEDLPRASLRRIFQCLDSLAAAVIDGDVPQAAAQAHFGEAVRSFWPWASQLLAPINQADEFWQPLPPLAQLYQQWK